MTPVREVSFRRVRPATSEEEKRACAMARAVDRIAELVVQELLKGDRGGDPRALYLAVLPVLVEKALK